MGFFKRENSENVITWLFRESCSTLLKFNISSAAVATKLTQPFLHGTFKLQDLRHRHCENDSLERSASATGVCNSQTARLSPRLHLGDLVVVFHIGFWTQNAKL